MIKYLKNDLKMYRIINKKLLYVTGIPYYLKNLNILSNEKYFGKFGLIKRIKFAQCNQNSKLFSLFILYSEESFCKNAIKTLDYSIIQCKKKTGILNFIINCTYGTSKYCDSFINKTFCLYKHCVFYHYIVPDNLLILKECLTFSSNSSLNIIKKKKLHDFSTENYKKVVFNIYIDKNFSDLIDNEDIFEYKRFYSFGFNN